MREYIPPPNSERPEILELGKLARLNTGVGNVRSVERVEKDTSGRITVLGAGSRHPLMSKLDRSREEFVRNKGWMPRRLSDLDRYDAVDMNTLSFVDTTKDGKIISSLRITEVNQAENCLSFEMVAPGTYEELSEDQRSRLDGAAQDGELYDITRLLPPEDESISSQDYLASIVKLFGYAAHHTAFKPDKSPIWICATEPRFRSFLTRLGIPSEVLKEADKDVPRSDQVVLYQIDPREALEYALSQGDRFSFSLENFGKGVDEAGLTPIR